MFYLKKEDEMEVTNNMLLALVFIAMAISITGTASILSQIPGISSITGFGVETQAGEANVTLAQEVSIELLVTSVDFNDLALDASNATTNLNVATGPAPLQLQNVGSIACNVSMAVDSGDDLWSDATSPSEYFLFNATTNGSTSALWYGGENETDKLAQVPAAGTYPSAAPVATLVYNLSHAEGVDLVLIGLNITAPGDEGAGPKGATLLFGAALG